MANYVTICHTIHVWTRVWGMGTGQHIHVFRLAIKFTKLSTYQSITYHFHFSITMQKKLRSNVRFRIQTFRYE